MTAVRGEMDHHIGSATTTSTSNGDHYYIAYCTPACLYSDLG